MQPTTHNPTHTDVGQLPPSAGLHSYDGALLSRCPDDAQLCIDVSLALLRTCPTLACCVAVTARAGVVHLRGSVGSERALVRAYKAARTVPGIHWVCNDVSVILPA